MGNLKLAEHLDEIQANIEKEIGLEPATLFKDFEKNDRHWQECRILDVTIAFFDKRYSTDLPYNRDAFKNLLHTILLLRSIGQ